MGFQIKPALGVLKQGPEAETPEEKRSEATLRRGKARRSTVDEANRAEEMQRRYGRTITRAGERLEAQDKERHARDTKVPAEDKRWTGRE